LSHPNANTSTWAYYTKTLSPRQLLDFTWWRDHTATNRKAKVTEIPTIHHRLYMKRQPSARDRPYICSN